jgi:hypothetical protein
MSLILDSDVTRLLKYIANFPICRQHPLDFFMKNIACEVCLVTLSDGYPA